MSVVEVKNGDFFLYKILVLDCSNIADKYVHVKANPIYLELDLFL
jgi:hypothetical protein